MSKQSFELEASVREDMGKGASRRLRRLNDLIPAIVYGGKKAAVSLSLEHRVVAKALENEAFYSHILDLKINGKKEKVVLKALQRHPFKPRIQHMDFQRVSATQVLTMQVPVHYLNESTAPGVKAGGIVSHHMTEVEIRCLGKDLPEYLEVDLGETQLDAILHLSDITLPKGIELTAISHGHDNDQPIASIHMPRRGAVDDESTSTDSESGEAEEKSGSE
jgi:large subunit ribosomal protein L25